MPLTGGWSRAGGWSPTVPSAPRASDSPPGQPTRRLSARRARSRPAAHCRCRPSATSIEPGGTAPAAHRFARVAGSPRRAGRWHGLFCTAPERTCAQQRSGTRAPPPLVECSHRRRIVLGMNAGDDPLESVCSFSERPMITATARAPRKPARRGSGMAAKPARQAVAAPAAEHHPQPGRTHQRARDRG